jgi:tetratricopeptide (TPR) repeat protein
MNATVFLIVLLLAPATHAESFKAWAARASREEREKDDKAAFQSYSNALSSWKPTDGKTARAKIFCARAALRDKSGDEEGAVGDFTECLATDKKNAKAFHRRGQIQLKAGRTSPAIDDFYKAIALDIRFGAAYADRAAAYEKQGDAGFAGEDYRHACELGVKAACPKAKELAPARKGKKKNAPAPAPAPAAAPAADQIPADAPVIDDMPPPSKKAAAPPSGPVTIGAPAPAAPAPETPRKRRKSAPTSFYTPKFTDCLHGLQACVDGGAAFGDCVGQSPACEQNSVKGCCPGSCLQAYRKSLNTGASEAEAYREIFIPEATCAAPAKSDDD